MLTFAYRLSFAIGGRTFNHSVNANLDGTEYIEPSAKVAIAHSGSLTTRTDNDTGVVTLSAGHGILTGDRVDLYWEVGGVKGKRLGMAATVAGNAVTVDLGAGDVLPAGASTIILAKAHEEPLEMDGDNIVAIAVSSEKRGAFVLADAADAALYTFSLPEDAMADGWGSGLGTVNPLAGTAIAKVFMSHVDTSVSRTMKVGIGS
jgi:hypothetical protein